MINTVEQTADIAKGKIAPVRVSGLKYCTLKEFPSFQTISITDHSTQLLFLIAYW